MFWRFGSDDDRRPGRGDGLVERRVEPPVRCDEARQRLDVRRAELGVRPPLEEAVDHRVGRPELLEDRRIGRVAGLRPLALRQVELEEQDLLELLRAAEVELVADARVDLALEPVDLGPELDVERGQRLAIEGDADGLHPGQDRDQRQLDLAEQAVEPLALEGGGERLARGDRRQGLEARPGEGRQLGRGRQDQVELLGDDVGDRLAAQARVEDVGGDLGVEPDRLWAAPGDPRRTGRRGAASPRGRRAASRAARRGAAGGRRRPALRPRPSGRPGRRRRAPGRSRRAAAGRRGRARLRRRAVRPATARGASIAVARGELDPAAGIGDRRGQRRRQVRRRLDGSARRA